MVPVRKESKDNQKEGKKTTEPEKKVSIESKSDFKTSKKSVSPVTPKKEIPIILQEPTEKKSDIQSTKKLRFLFNIQ